MSLPENHFFEVKWVANDNTGRPLSHNGFVTDWGVPVGATGWVAVVELGTNKCWTIQHEKLEVLGIVDLKHQRERAGTTLPVRQVTLRRK